jgi:hypothetical protein
MINVLEQLLSYEKGQTYMSLRPFKCGQAGDSG